MHVVQFSGGVGSWAAARRVAERHGTENLTMLFADVLIEDDDLYRFVIEAAADVGGVDTGDLSDRADSIPSVTDPEERAAYLGALAEDAMAAVPVLRWTRDGRTPWDVFRDVRFLGNTMVDPCSRVLKRELLRKWMDDRLAPDETTVYLGIDWTESHRMRNAAKRWAPWAIEAPLCEAPLVEKDGHLASLIARGIRPPRLYGQGFPHNNCGGFCVKAGQAQFELLLRTNRDLYLFHEQREQELRDLLGADGEQRDVAILRDRTVRFVDGQRVEEPRPITMREFRERIEEQPELFDAEEWGACGCAVDG